MSRQFHFFIWIAITLHVMKLWTHIMEPCVLFHHEKNITEIALPFCFVAVHNKATILSLNDHPIIFLRSQIQTKMEKEIHIFFRYERKFSLKAIRHSFGSCLHPSLSNLVQVTFILICLLHWIAVILFNLLWKDASIKLNYNQTLFS